MASLPFLLVSQSQPIDRRCRLGDYMESHQIKCVLLADRHQGLTEGVRQLLEGVFDAVLMAADAKSLLEGAERLQPVLAVVELSLAQSDSLEVIRQLRSRSPKSKVIVLSMHSEPSTMRAAIDAGAHGYVLKSAITTDLMPAVEAVLAGGAYGSPEISRKNKPGAGEKPNTNNSETASNPKKE